LLLENTDELRVQTSIDRLVREPLCDGLHSRAARERHNGIDARNLIEYILDELVLALPLDSGLKDVSLIPVLLERDPKCAGDHSNLTLATRKTYRDAASAAQHQHSLILGNVRLQFSDVLAMRYYH
jgi:hypothetical protein